MQVHIIEIGMEGLIVKKLLVILHNNVTKLVTKLLKFMGGMKEMLKKKQKMYYMLHQK